MTKRHILFYIHGLAGGGAERVFAVLASQLAKNGHAVTMVNDFEAPENNRYLHAAVKSIVIGRRHIRGISRLRRILRQEKPDVVVAGLGASNLKMTVAHLLAGHASALVLTYHSRFELERRPLGRLGYIATPAISRIADWTLAVSEDLARYAVEIWGAPAKRTSCIYNPVLVPAGAARITPAALAERANIVLGVGRLVPEKDYVSLIRGFAKLSRPDAELIILGEGPERRQLQAEVERLGLIGRVSLPGYVPEPWPYFEKAKCFVLTSRSESFGNVVVEALGHGLPVVSTKSPGPEEILEQGRYGTLVPVGDVAAIAEALNEALDDPGDPGPRQARASAFSAEPIAARYSALFEAVLNARTS